MHIDPVNAAARGASVIVTLKGQTLLHLPGSDIGRHLAAAPEVTFLSLLGNGFQFVATSPTADLASGADGGFDRYPADLAVDCYLARPSPSGRVITRLGTISARSCRDLTCRPIERLSAVITRKRLAVLGPVERLAGYTLVPRRRFRGGISALSVAVSSRAVFAWDGLSTVLAWMWSGLHPGMMPQDNEYVEMAEAAE